MVKYFLYVYPSDSNEELNTSQETDLGNASIECEAEQDKDGSGCYIAYNYNIASSVYVSMQ